MVITICNATDKNHHLRFHIEVYTTTLSQQLQLRNIICSGLFMENIDQWIGLPIF